MSLSDRVDSFPEPWKPEPGDKLVGTVMNVGERASDYGIYPIIDVRTEDDEELTFHAFHTVAKNELARQRPAPGDEIAVKYFGKDEDRGYERYRVLVEKAEPKGLDAAAWDEIGKDAEQELEQYDGGDAA
jgi:hypothetical protein